MRTLSLSTLPPLPENTELAHQPTKDKILDASSLKDTNPRKQVVGTPDLGHINPREQVTAILDLGEASERKPIVGPIVGP